MNTSTLRAHRLKRLVSTAVFGTLLLGAVAACGAGGDGGDDSTVEPTTVTPTTEAATSGPESAESEESEMPEETTPRLDPSMGSDKPGSQAEKTISGTVESGVESGCLILEHEGTVYGLFEFDSEVVYAGAEVTVHGHVEKNMMSFCQQGPPFVVEDAEPAR